MTRPEFDCPIASYGFVIDTYIVHRRSSYPEKHKTSMCVRESIVPAVVNAVLTKVKQGLMKLSSLATLSNFIGQF